MQLVMPVLGKLWHYGPDRTGDLYEFGSPHGIMGVTPLFHDDELHLLALKATAPGSGQFRKFWTACKQHYTNVLVMWVENDVLVETLKRYGFHPEVFWQNRPPNNPEIIPSWRWRS